jgi:hypothetical protein
MIAVPGPVGPFVVLRKDRQQASWELLMKFCLGIRRGCSGVACALLLACLGIPAAVARAQSSTASSTSSKVTSSKVTSSKATSSKTKASSKKKHHKTAPSAGKSAAGTSHTVASKGKRSSRRRPRGQQKIDAERAQAIQEALIREHYLTGEPTDTWNQASEDAMRRYQADHGWQSKTVPDSRALIKLGLGPSHDHLLNPESAMTTAPDSTRATSLNPVSHSTSPAAPASKHPTSDPVPATSSTPTEPSRPQ